jgi:molybdopterin molybdotransferase
VRIEVVKPVAPLENVVQAGDDIKKGEIILGRGHRMRPQDMGALAGVGITRIPVFQQPQVAIINTGNEVVSADSAPAPGQVRDINSYNLEGLIAQAGGMPVKRGIIPDDYDRLREALEAALRDCDLVVMTGGSSVGTMDLTAKVINDWQAGCWYGVHQAGQADHGCSIPLQTVPVFDCRDILPRSASVLNCSLNGPGA